MRTVIVRTEVFLSILGKCPNVSTKGRNRSYLPIILFCQQKTVTRMSTLHIWNCMIAYYILLSVCVSSPHTKLDQRGAKYHFFPLLLRLDGDVSGLLIVALCFLFRAPGQTFKRSPSLFPKMRRRTLSRAWGQPGSGATCPQNVRRNEVGAESGESEGSVEDLEWAMMSPPPTPRLLLREQQHCSASSPGCLRDFVF